jgi:hypothetical protein
MAPLRSSSDTGKGGLRRSGDDAFQLTIQYLKQETIQPLKGLGRFLAWGIAGSFAIAAGVLLLLVGVLRLLQQETGTALGGDWSWVPYVVVIVLGAGVIGVAIWRITAGPGEAKLPKVKAARGETETSHASGVVPHAGPPSTPPVHLGFEPAPTSPSPSPTTSTEEGHS